jgi:hypothetical protein
MSQKKVSKIYERFISDPSFTNGFDIVILHGNSRSSINHTLAEFIRFCICEGQDCRASHATWTDREGRVIEYLSSSKYIKIDIQDNSSAYAVASLIKSISSTKPIDPDKRHIIIIDGPDKAMIKMQPVVKSAVQYTPGNALFVIVWPSMVGADPSFLGCAFSIQIPTGNIVVDTSNNPLERHMQSFVNNVSIDVCNLFARRLTERQIPIRCIALALLSVTPSSIHNDIIEAAADADVLRNKVGRAIVCPYTELLLRVMLALQKIAHEV